MAIPKILVGRAEKLPPVCRGLNKIYPFTLPLE
jgi:hypothetical protein